MFIIILSFLIEAIWETVKMIFEDGKFSVDRLGVMVISVMFCFLYGVDLFHYLEIADITIPGTIGTGIIVSRGSNFIHDILRKLEEVV